MSFVFDVPTEEEAAAEAAAEAAEEKLRQVVEENNPEVQEEPLQGPGQQDWLEEDDTEYLADVDQKLEVATYFRTLLRQSLFSDTSTAARFVERKVRSFVKEQLEILLSLRLDPEKTIAAVVVPQFDEAEVAALKMVAARLIKKPDLAPPVPTVKPAAAPPAPRVPTVVPAVVPKRPTVAPAPTKPTPAAVAPTPPKRGPGRPPKVQEEIKLVPHPHDSSVMVEIHKPRVQKPRNAVPFPTDMEGATAAAAHRGASAVAAANPGHAGLARIIVSQS